MNQENNQKFGLWVKIFMPALGLLSEAYFPSFCVYCRENIGLEEKYLCRNCLNNIEIIKTRTCIKCGMMTKYGQNCPDCRPNSKLAGIIYLTRHEGPVKELIHWFKYEKMLGIGEMLFSLIEKGLGGYSFKKFDLISSVPLHWEKKLKRGFNQSEKLAKKVAKWQQISYLSLLKRVKDTDPQMKLKRSQRLLNLEGAFKVRKSQDISNKRILIVDDVTTTGATLEECARVFKEAGAKSVWGLVIAHGK